MRLTLITRPVTVEEDEYLKVPEAQRVDLLEEIQERLDALQEWVDEFVSNESILEGEEDDRHEG